MKPVNPFRTSLATLFYGMIAVTVGCVVFTVWNSATRIRNDSGEVAKSTNVGDPRSRAPEMPLPPKSDFIGSAACATCHAQIVETYLNHSAMGRSLWEVNSAPIVEDFSNRNSFSPDGHHMYLVEKTDDGVFHHERLTDREGQTLYDQSVRINYALGSGNQGRSYLIDRGGLMFMSPITWYSHGGRWDLSPQYKLPVHRRFERRIIDECLNCHTGRINSLPNADHRYETPPFIEMSIGCERCHGPGGEHAALRRRDVVPRAVDPIVNPSKLDAARREDVCVQCHLQGESSYARYGCRVGDFRPGQRLEETRIVFVQGTRTSPGRTTRAVSQVEQMRASHCFQASDGRFGCISCHDPHSRVQAQDAASFYRAKCLDCHADKGCALPERDRRLQQSDDSCVACHMPRLGVNDVPHTAQTDHRVLRMPSTQPAQNGPVGLPEFYDNADERLPRFAVDYARGLWLADHAEKTSDRELAQRALLLLSIVDNQCSNDVRIIDALGAAAATQGKVDDAVNQWKRSLSIDPDRELTLEKVVLVLHTSGRGQDARPYLERLLKLNPWKSSLWGRYAMILGQAKQWNAAIEAAKKAQELDPSAPHIYRFLAEAFRQVGDAEQSERFREQFEKIQRFRE